VLYVHRELPALIVDWTSSADTILRDAYRDNRYGSNCLKRAARELTRRGFSATPSSILRRAVCLGLTVVRERYRWSREELDVLEHVAHLSVEHIQKKLAPLAPPGVKRTRAAIIRQIHENRLRTNLDGLNHEHLANALGIAVETLHKYRIEGLIKSHGRLESLDLHKMTGPKITLRAPWFYSNEEIRRFVCLNPNLFNLGRVAKEWFIDLLRDGRYEQSIVRSRERKHKKERQNL
jgi:hypothetical protein